VEQVERENQISFTCLLGLWGDLLPVMPYFTRSYKSTILSSISSGGVTEYSSPKAAPPSTQWGTSSELGRWFEPTSLAQS
jgi:hypothetical protein